MKKRFLILFFVVGLTIVLAASSAIAERLVVLGRPLDLFFYVTQNLSYSLLDKDKYDTVKGFQGTLNNLLVEAGYGATDQLKFYASAGLTTDFMYKIREDGRAWNEKLFDQSSKNLYMDHKYWQIVKEAHVTWTPGNFFFRGGKQIVKWGETDGFRLMDQINPSDSRRGFADVEFETSVIPIWLLRAEYYLPQKPSWLQDLGFEFVFNPNADFIPNQGPRTGNDEGGIWAPNALARGPFPFGEAHVGSTPMNIKEPGRFNSEGYEYAFRAKGVIKDAIITLNYFYGVNNDPVLLTAPIPPKITVASDGRLILHPFLNGKFPRFHFVGGTLAKDITPLRVDFLGGISPVLRLETLYAFNSTFVNNKNALERHDEFRWAVGVDWGVRIPILNPTNSFSISPQFYQQRIINYPGIKEIKGLKEDNYTTTLAISTKYLHQKLTPSVFWMYDITNKANMYRLQAVYDLNDSWQFTLGALWLHGEKFGKGFQLFDNKDYMFFKVRYKWG